MLPRLYVPLPEGFQNPWSKRTTTVPGTRFTSSKELDLLLLTVATPRKLQRDGIHCHGLRYFSITDSETTRRPVKHGP